MQNSHLPDWRIDRYKVLDSELSISIETIIQAFEYYMEGEPSGIPSKKTYLENVESKLKDPEFLADTSILLQATDDYEPEAGYKKVKELLLSKM